MFTALDSVMFNLLSTVFFLAIVVLGICLILVAIFAVIIFIKRLIFGDDDCQNTVDNNDKKDKDAVVGFALKNNNIRRE